MDTARRRFNRVVAACVLFAAGIAVVQPLSAQATPPPGAEAGSAAFIRQSGNELATLAGSAKTPAGRHHLAAFIDRVVDVDAVARFCLGRFWRRATAVERQQYEAAFGRVLVNSVIARLGNYQGGTARVVISRPVQEADGIHVATTVMQPNDPPARVTWVVSMATGSPKIVDVVAEGMSLRLTQRSDYASFLSHHNDDVGALIAALRQQAASD